MHSVTRTPVRSGLSASRRRRLPVDRPELRRNESQRVTSGAARFAGEWASAPLRC
ncbi:hypothetical protein AKJ09_03459 [Labilithrix luteola]|uniref:Uncharacterized protein n=1 Tax=Labilithrix luteola TaxID=1391654 RepID=A0A0K1PTE3_9BACT|nr:hypothetical protein AKJ09_03459 [Labilithrix luteola]